MHRTRIFVTMLSVFTLGCGDASSLSGGGLSSGGTGDFGATQGGTQDMQLARDLVTAGQVPPADAFIVEGMFSEHDLPVDGAACSTTLCLRGTMGIAPDRSGETAAWMQVGLSSTIDPQTYVRPSVALVAVVDVSGSMGWKYTSSSGDAPAGTGREPGAVARQLLRDMASELNEADQFSMVTFGSSTGLALDWTGGDNPAIQAAIDELDEGGATNMEAGLQYGYRIAERASTAMQEVRVVLLTDVQPNVGATGGSNFERMVSEAATDNIHTTVFALGLGAGVGTANQMSHLSGANGFTLDRTSEVLTFMADNWPWFVAPIAYDLQLTATPSDDLILSRAYGFPSGEPGSALPEARSEVSTVFLSKKKGALLLQLNPSPDSEFEDATIELSLSYTEPDGTEHLEDLSTGFTASGLDERGADMPQVGIDKAVALALLVDGMHEAASLYASDAPAAIAVMRAVLGRIDGDAAAIDDPTISEEATFWSRLLVLMERGADQGNLYGQ